MSSSAGGTHQFGDCTVHADDRRLSIGGKFIAVPPKAFATLLILLEHPGQLVRKEEFMQRVWEGRFVEEVALAHAISQLRKLLGDSGKPPRIIETVSKLGYRFIADVHKRENAASATPAVVIAVLPFSTIGATETEYLADGLTEELIAALGQADPDHLAVIGRTSMMTYRNSSKSLKAIGGELGAAFLVESSLRGDRQRVRITSRLIRVEDQVQIWSASYDSEPGDVLEFQRELSVAIVQQISAKLSPQRLDHLSQRHSAFADAYDSYLRGRYFWNQLSPPTTRRALECFTQAAKLDPNYSLAWSGLADANSTAPITGDADPRKVWRSARENAANAVRCGGRLAEAHTSVGFLKFWLDWDWDGATAEFRKAIELDPSYAIGHRMLGMVLSQSLKHEEALAATARARQLDPLDFTHHALSAHVAFNAGQLSFAIELARKAVMLNPQFWIGHFQLAQACEQTGDWDVAFEALHQATLLSGGNSKALGLRGYLLARTDKREQAQQILETIEDTGRQRYMPSYAKAIVHLGLGESQEALSLLEQSLEEHDVHLMFLTSDPKWNPCRHEPRFIELLARCAFHAGGTAFPLD